MFGGGRNQGGGSPSDVGGMNKGGGAGGGSRLTRDQQERLCKPAVILLDLIIPDFVPFADEVLLGLVTLMLGSFRRKQGRAPQAPEKGEVIDVTPESGDD